MTRMRVMLSLAAVVAGTAALSAQSALLTIVLTGQSMLRADPCASQPSAMPVIKGMLSPAMWCSPTWEAAVAMPGETIREGSAGFDGAGGVRCAVAWEPIWSPLSATPCLRPQGDWFAQHAA